MEQIKEDLKEIKVELKELVKHQAVMNQTLIEHERRSTNLETRIIPLERTNIILMFCASVSMFAVTIYRVFFH